MLKRTIESVDVSEAGLRLAVGVADAAQNAGELARVCPEAAPELRRSRAHLIEASRAVTEAVELLAGDRQPAEVVH